MVIEDGLMTVLFALPWVLVPVVVVGTIWYQVRRNKAVKAWAAASGWTYVGTDPSLVGRWDGEPFNQGHSRRTSEVMVGRWAGRPAVSFTYTYRTGSGKDESTYSFHVLALPLPAYLSTLELTPEDLGSRLAKAFGGQDIQFESEEFNRAWRVRSPNPKFAHDVVHPRLMERLMRADARGVCLRLGGTDILTWSAGQTVPERIAGRLGLMTAVVESVPRFVWQDHGYDPGPPVVRTGPEGSPADPMV
ncbi:hypothetical protein [Actinotalea fermentans]|uniref:DUF3137 domain-containing protein n=1 Tax=Actinotalea fermentans TaxID=43671 RepID=A0A511YYU5_9CELL|nr:hypothetical protein [Actinotalea fermentans]KGM16551.1 hypothetical protein N867_18840 [Actinotalea fermentans ATCC 43279 = JCM 9966 = DSM 3133]GEN80377.1 hypothetical protein AFE02nite_21110 [Actinotalea fermentans]